MDEFIAKRLVNYDECKSFYIGRSLKELIDEVRFFSNDDVKAIPFEYSGARHSAFLDAVIDLVANYRNMSSGQRSLLISTLILPFMDYILDRTAAENRAQVKTAIDITCYEISKSGLFPQVGELILRRCVDYDGSFALNPASETQEE